MKTIVRTKKYVVRYVDPFFGDPHGGTVWAEDLDDAVEHAWNRARCEDWFVLEVVGRDGEMSFPEPAEPFASPFAFPQIEDALLSDQYTGVTKEQADELAHWVYGR